MDSSVNMQEDVLREFTFVLLFLFLLLLLLLLFVLCC